ncbi:MAG: MarC family protein, partial [Pseudomonadota bacterium]|nr:MarC family protein [Pseudomonadota bacterium]
MEPYLTAFGLFFGLLNPFLMSIYLLDLILALSARRFLTVMARGSLIAGAVFIAFAWAGEAVFAALHVRFAA